MEILHLLKVEWGHPLAEAATWWIQWVLRSGPKCLGTGRPPATSEVKITRVVRVSKDRLSPLGSFVFTQLYLGFGWETGRVANRAPSLAPVSGPGGRLRSLLVSLQLFL